MTQCEDDGQWRPVNVTCIPPLPPPPGAIPGPGLVPVSVSDTGSSPGSGPGIDSDSDSDSSSSPGSGSGSGSGPTTGQHGQPVTHHEQHEPMSSGVVAGILVVAIAAIIVMIIVGILFRKRYDLGEVQTVITDITYQINRRRGVGGGGRV